MALHVWEVTNYNVLHSNSENIRQRLNVEHAHAHTTQVRAYKNRRRTSKEPLLLLVPLVIHLGLREATGVLKYGEPLRCWGIVQNDIRQHGYPTLPGKMAQPRRQVTCQEGRGYQPVKKRR